MAQEDIKKEKPKRFGLLGKNIDYSFSRNYFSKKLYLFTLFEKPKICAIRI